MSSFFRRGHRLCKFDNAGTLLSFDPNINNGVYTLAIDASDDQYVGGEYTTVGGSITRNNLCKFDNTGSLQSFDPIMSGGGGNVYIFTLEFDASGKLHVGGNFASPTNYYAIYSFAYPNGVFNTTNRNEVIIYPNPTSSMVNVDIKSNISQKSSIKLFDLNGRMIKETKTTNSSIQIDMSRFPAGIYMLQVLQNNKVVSTQKVEKK